MLNKGNQKRYESILRRDKYTKFTVKKTEGCFVSMFIFSNLNSWDFSLFQAKLQQCTKIDVNCCEKKNTGKVITYHFCFLTVVHD